MSEQSESQGVHLVGSIPLRDSRRVFKTTSSILGDYIARVPDGETGIRSNWVDWQLPLLESNPDLEVVVNDVYEYTQIKMFGIREGSNFSDLDLGPLGYAEAAINSYSNFRELKLAGDLPTHYRFQVCLPTPLATTHLYIHPSLQAGFETQYEERMLAELDQIIAAIPADELAIQWDTAVEFALLEGVMPTYIEDPEMGINERLARLGAAVPEPVELGFHLCYGDSGHKHFCEPKDMAKLVAVSNCIADRTQRTVNWIHMPVPRNRSDSNYFKPLENLRLSESTRLYLGLIHHTDGASGARSRIAAAKKHYPRFGVATECGFGRRPPDIVEELMNLHVRVVESML